jgi:hypothetical protein
MNQMAMSFVQTRARRSDCATSNEAAKAAVTRKADAERAAIRKCVNAPPGGLTARRDGCAVWKAV